MGTITTAENVTTALHSVIGAIPEVELRGRRILIAADCFPSLHFLLAGAAQRKGFTLDTVPPRPGETWVRDEDFLAKWTPDVAIALLTYVTSTASHRCRVNELVAHGHAKGSLVGIDITQGVGIVPFSVGETPADFVVGSTLKWLCGTTGAGALYVSGPLLQRCHPELRGWFSQENPFSWDLDRFAFASDARRFDHGTPSVAACIASLPALEWHASQDPAKLLAHNRTLGGLIIDMATELNLPLISPRNADERGGSIMVRLPDSVAVEELLGELRKADVYADVRGSALRLSPGNLTSVEGVQRLERVLGNALRS